MNKIFKCLNGFVLKWIALITMFIDHFGAIFMPDHMIYRYIGRISFPIFVFLLVEGFFHTKNIRKYEIRLLIFAFISEIPFDLAFHGIFPYWDSQNVFFTLFLGLVMLNLIQRKKGNLLWEIFLLVVFMAAAYLMLTDYDAAGILWIYSFYKFRNKFFWQIVVLGLVSLFYFGFVELFCVFAIIPIILYNGERGFIKKDGIYKGQKNDFSAVLVKYMFYLAYPIHLLIYYGIYMLYF